MLRRKIKQPRGIGRSRYSFKIRSRYNLKMRKILEQNKYNNHGAV